MTPEEEINFIKYIIYKIKYNYTNKNIQNILNKCFDKYFKYYYNTFKTNYSEFINFINSIRDYYTNTIKIRDDVTFGYGVGDQHHNYDTYMLKKLGNDCYFCLFYMQVLIMDIYFLRRLLDKDYITNVVSYTGGLHSSFYVYILVKYFNFDVTHYDHSKLQPKEIKDYILKTEDDAAKFGAIISEILLPEEPYQCTNIENFPPIFE